MITSSSQYEQSSDGAPRFPQSQNVARTMSSREIADLTGKRHDHVIRDIRNMLSELQITDPKFGGTYLDGSGRSMPCFHLDRELTETLVTGYSIPLRHKVIRRLHELEDAQAKPAFDIASLNDPKVLLALLTDNVRKVVALEADNTELSKENHELEVKVEQDAPKVAFHDMVVVSNKTYNAAQAAKIIGTGRTRLLQFMRQKGWVTRSNEPYQAKIEAGLLDVKLGTFEHPIQGTIPTCSTLITGKGLTKLEALWRERDADLLA
ncbi:phage regulatory protein/antirepressor Ant [Pseudomonas extremaustralis]|uniref:phage regulatory protein/antirepressor Ant n=1 Tax=Pseudomonas extremaustralis TaxID=359110 RepID=UPI0023E00D0E|nr:phage regulatory protein/antirepressor Ant [Pseudomonas extremaustralis]MDF3136636.1 phage regulatory protein/antirepressor Ant [Pseudomonas extremaustralis]